MYLNTGLKFKHFIPFFLIYCLLCELASGSKKHTNFDDTKVLVEIISQAKEVRTSTNSDGSIVFIDPLNNEQYLGSGWIYELRKNGTIMGIGKLNKGMLNGVVASWYSNGNKKAEETFDHSKLITIERWKPNGLKCNQTKVENGNGQTFEYDSESNVTLVRFWKEGIVVEEVSLLNPAK